MSSLNIYDFTVPTLINSLTALSNVLTKASTSPHAASLDPTTIKLIDDMKPLTFQIQSACNTAKFIPVRVAGVPNVPVDDNETTFDELRSRIALTVDFLKGVSRDAFAGKEGDEVVFRDLKFTGLSYVNKFAMPNFYFHVAAAYCILRAKGVEIGKLDYLGAIKDQTEY